MEKRDRKMENKKRKLEKGRPPERDGEKKRDLAKMLAGNARSLQCKQGTG